MDHENRMRRDADFARWYTVHHDRIRSQCARLLRDDAAGEDLAQETLLRAWTRRDSIREEDVGAWLSVVARNACVSYLRKHGRALPVEVVPELPNDEADPSLILERKEARKAVRRALNEIGERHRRALYLREVEEVAVDELGAEMGLTAGGTRALLFRARAVLRERLALAGQGLGAWLVGIRVKVGSAYRRARSSLGSAEAAPVLQAGVNLALAAGLAVSSVAGADLLRPSSAASRPAIASIVRTPVERSEALRQVPKNVHADAEAMSFADEKPAFVIRAGRSTSVQPDFRYDKKTQDHAFGAIVDAPVVGPQCVCISGHQPEGGHSITWDVVINPTIEKLCDAAPGYCQSS